MSGTKSDEMLAFHRERSLEHRSRRGSYADGQFYVRFCFADPADGVPPTIPCYHPKWTPITTARILPRLINRSSMPRQTSPGSGRSLRTLTGAARNGRGRIDAATLEGCLRALEHHREVLMDCLRNAERRSAKL